MADDVDNASDKELHANEARVALHMSRQKPPPEDWDRVHCYNPVCEDELPKERISAGRYLCVHCKSEEERRNKR